MYLLCRVHGKNFALSEVSSQKLSNTLPFKPVGFLDKPVFHFQVDFFYDAQDEKTEHTQ